MKKICILLVAFLLTMAFLAGCAGNNNTSSVSGNTETSGITSDESVAAVEVRDMKGKVITVACWDYGTLNPVSFGSFTGEILYNDDDATATQVDAAKKQTVEYIQETYNCVIEGDMFTSGDMLRTIYDTWLSGDNMYDMAFVGLSSCASYVPLGLFEDINTISSINLDNVWWDQVAREDLSILNRLFFMVGDINTFDNDGTFALMFNKNMLERMLPGEDLYAYARNGEWDYDTFLRILKSNITNDSNGDGTLDEKDTWSLGTEKYNMYLHILAGGDKIVTKNEDDEPVYAIGTNAINNFLRIQELFADESLVMVANTPKYENKGLTNVWEQTVQKSFIEGRELFYMGGLWNVPAFRNMEDDFGILPIPKMSATQDRYYHSVSNGNMTCMTIMANNEDVEGLGVLIEAIARESYIRVTPAYYEKQLKGRYTRDNDSSEMLDIIFSTRSFDLGSIFNWGSMYEAFTTIDSNIVSRLESNKGAFDNALDKTMDDIKSRYS